MESSHQNIEIGWSLWLPLVSQSQLLLDKCTFVHFLWDAYYVIGIVVVPGNTSVNKAIRSLVPKTLTIQQETWTYSQVIVWGAKRYTYRNIQKTCSYVPPQMTLIGTLVQVILKCSPVMHGVIGPMNAEHSLLCQAWKNQQ